MDIAAENEVAELRVGEKHNEKHERKAHQVLGAVRDGLGQLRKKKKKEEKRRKKKKRKKKKKQGKEKKTPKDD